MGYQVLRLLYNPVMPAYHQYMTDRERTIVYMRLRNDPVSEIANSQNTSVDNINRILSKANIRKFKENEIQRRNSRNFLENGARIERLLGTVIESLEYAMDDAVTDMDRLALSGKVSEISKLVVIPEVIPDDAERILLLPETATIKDFNRPSIGVTDLAGSGYTGETSEAMEFPIHPPDEAITHDSEAPIPQSANDFGGGSKMPPSISGVKNVEYPEIENNFYGDLVEEQSKC